MAILYPTPEEVEAAIAWAVDVRRARVRRKPEGLLLSEAALAERVSAYAIKPQPHGIGWWVVGILVDTTDPDHSEYEILMASGTPLLRTTPRYPVEPRKPAKPSRWYFSGERKRWEVNPNVPDDGEPPPLGSR